MSKLRFVSAACVAATFAFSGTANAGTIHVQQQGSHVYFDENDANPLFARTEFLVGTTAVTDITAGAFRLNGTRDNGDKFDFLAFCLEPLEGLVFPKDHEEINIFDSTVTSRLFTLASNALGLVDTRKKAAAFQMAAWEITTEESINPYNINDGYFKITSDRQRSNKAELLAQEWLENISTGFWAPSTETYLVLKADGTQDLLTDVKTDIPQAPLPAAGLSLLTALLGVGGYIKRRQKA